MQALCLAFLRSTAARGYANHMEELVGSVNSEAKRAKHAEKKAKNKAKAAEERVKEVGKNASQALSAALDEAEDYQQSNDFHVRLLAEYKEGMQDMKVSFAITNPTVTRVDWSFVPEVFGEIAVEGEGV